MKKLSILLLSFLLLFGQAEARQQLQVLENGAPKTSSVDIDDIPSSSTPTPIGSGGTGQVAQDEAFDALAPTTTLGDIIVRGASDNVRIPVGTNGFVPFADSGATNGVDWYQPAARPTTQTGRYLTPTCSSTLSTATLAANTQYVAPVYVGTRQTFTAVGFSVSAFTYVATTLNITTGIYVDAGGVPGALVAGSSVATAISTTVAAATNYDGTFISPLELTPGRYWLVILADSPSTTTITALPTNCNANLTGVSTMANQNGARISKSQTYGSGLANPFGSPTYNEASATPWLGLKAQ